MVLIDNYYYDDNQNRWHIGFACLEDIEEYSKGMETSSHCENCINCVYCYMCNDCKNLIGENFQSFKIGEL